MALGYEGLIDFDGTYVLGTGSSAPSTRVLLESSGAYGGTIDGSNRGVGTPYNVDWSQSDGSINFEMTPAVASKIGTWLTSRQTGKTITLKPRSGGSQVFTNSFFNSISISTSEGGVVDGSIGFVALTYSHSWGSDYIGNRKGRSCPIDPPPLNPSFGNINPIPFWKTSVSIGTQRNFINWSLDYTQEVVKFFGCNSNTTVKEPLYVAVGPMTVSFSGSYMEPFPGTNSFPSDTLTSMSVGVDSTTFTLLKLEAISKSDDVQSGDALVPLTVEYAAYGIS